MNTRTLITTNIVTFGLTLLVSSWFIPTKTPTPVMSDQQFQEFKSWSYHMNKPDYTPELEPQEPDTGIDCSDKRYC